MTSSLVPRSLAARVLFAAAALGLAPLAAPRVLAAQQVIQPSRRQTLDPARVRVRRDLLALSDSLLRVQAAIAQFERNPSGASDAVLLSRARTLTRACHVAQRQIEPTRATVRDTKIEAVGIEKRRAALLDGFAPFVTALVACDSSFRRMSAPAASRELRDWGLYRAHKLRDDFNAFQRLINNYMAGAGIRITPATLEDPLEG